MAKGVKCVYNNSGVKEITVLLTYHFFFLWGQRLDITHKIFVSFWIFRVYSFCLFILISVLFNFVWLSWSCTVLNRTAISASIVSIQKHWRKSAGWNCIDLMGLYPDSIWPYKKKKYSGCGSIIALHRFLFLNIYKLLKLVTLPRLECPVCFNILPIAAGRIKGFIPFTRVLIWLKKVMQVQFLLETQFFL